MMSDKNQLPCFRPDTNQTMPDINTHVKLHSNDFRIPYESMRRNFKAIQKLEERQFKKMDELMNDLNQHADKEAQKKVLKGMIANMKAYDKKVRAKVEAEGDLRGRIKARVEKLGQLTVDEKAWFHDEINLLIADYLLKNNSSKRNTGEALLKRLGFEKLIDTDVILVSNRISNEIKRGKLDGLMKWIGDNKSYLKKIRSNLEFEAKLQECIEFVKADEISTAISQFRTLSELGNIHDIQLASGLLVFAKKAAADPTNPIFAKYSRLLSPNRYAYISDIFLNIYNKLHGISPVDPLLIYLSLGLSSLKTRSCHHQATPTDFSTLLSTKLEPKTTCPVCSVEFTELAGKVPYGHNVRSYLFDDAVMTPGGNVYDRKKLMLLKSESGVKDPMSGEIFGLEELVTMYPT